MKEHEFVKFRNGVIVVKLNARRKIPLLLYHGLLIEISRLNPNWSELIIKPDKIIEEPFNILTKNRLNAIRLSHMGSI